MPFQTFVPFLKLSILCLNPFVLARGSYLLLTESLFSTSSFSSPPWDVFHIITFYSLLFRMEKCSAQNVNTHHPLSHTFIPCLPFLPFVTCFPFHCLPFVCRCVRSLLLGQATYSFFHPSSPLQVTGCTTALFSVTSLFPFLQKHTQNAYPVPRTLLSTRDTKTDKKSLFQLGDPPN